MVVYDDLDLPAGQLRVRRAAVAARGTVASTRSSTACGPEFARVRVGIGRPLDGQDVADYVLAAAVGRPSLSTYGGASSAPAMRSSVVVTEGIAAAMNRFNIRAAWGYGMTTR